MSAGMDCGHGEVFNERELFHGESFVQILSLNILFDFLVVNWSSVIFGGTEVHSGSMIILVVNNVHFIKSEVILVFFF